MINFRRKLKHILKNWQRQDMNKPQGYKLITPKLRELGYTGRPCDIIYFLLYCPSAKGRVLGRLGRAALKQNKIIPLLTAGYHLQTGQDPRTVTFYSEYEEYYD